MKTIVVVILLAVAMSSCATIGQVAPVVCATAEDVCHYAYEMCRVINDTTYTQAQVDSVSAEFYSVQSRFYRETQSTKPQRRSR